MDHRGASSVVAVTLMLVVAAFLATTVGVMALGITDDIPTPGPQVALTVGEYSPEGDDNGGVPYLTIYHQAGDIADSTSVFIVDEDGNRVAWADVSTTGSEVGSGSAAHIDGCGTDGALNRITAEGQVYRVVFESSDGETLSMREVTVPSPPDPEPC